MDPLSVKRRLSCILAADAVGYSRQMEQDEESTIRVLAAHRAVIDGIITFHGGRIISTAGDSVLAEFSSAVEAVRCAVEIQEALKTRNDALPDKSQMHFRVGVNLGDVVVKNDDLLGDGVNVAARLETIAEPGGICISSSVYDQITGKLDLGFQDIGEQTLKNISRPIRVYRVSGTAKPQRSAPPAPPPRRSHASLPWAIAGAVVAVVGVAAWQLGWLSFGVPGRVSPGAPAPVAAPVASAPSPPQRADREPQRRTPLRLRRKRRQSLRARAPKPKPHVPPGPRQTPKRRQTGYGARPWPTRRAFAPRPRRRQRAREGADATRDAGSQAPAATHARTLRRAGALTPPGPRPLMPRTRPLALPQSQLPGALASTVHGPSTVTCEPMGREHWATSLILSRK